MPLRVYGAFPRLLLIPSHEPKRFVISGPGNLFDLVNQAVKEELAGRGRIS